jgi:hypothetical protein
MAPTAAVTSSTIFAEAAPRVERAMMRKGSIRAVESAIMFALTMIKCTPYTSPGRSCLVIRGSSTMHALKARMHRRSFEFRSRFETHTYTDAFARTTGYFTRHRCRLRSFQESDEFLRSTCRSVWHHNSPVSPSWPSPRRRS